MRYYIYALLSFFILSSSALQAQSFDKYFIDKTLRIDYTFVGTTKSQDVALDQLNELPQWSGRKNNLSEVLRKGNGQITVTDLATKKMIYKDAFSSLFQEWLTTPEAETTKKSFENTFLVPFPRNKVEIEISFRNEKGEYKSALKHIVDPRDILIKKLGLTDHPKHTYLHRGDTSIQNINVVILAEGYRNDEMLLFIEHAKTSCSEIFAHSPFDEMKDRFNFIAVETASKQSGVSVPLKSDWKTTAFSSHFDTFYSDRYLTTSHVKDVHDAVAGIPYSHIIILANTPVYGGGGIFNAYTLTSTGHSDFKPVVVHEFGHSFGGLADEYFYEGDIFDNTYPHDIEPWEPNITTLTHFAGKWEDMLFPKTTIPTEIEDRESFPVGVYEGAGYSAKGVYRPAFDCRMKTNSCKNFCPVCQRAIKQLIKFYTE